MANTYSQATTVNTSAAPELTVYAQNNQSIPAISGNVKVVITNTEQFVTNIYNLKATAAGTETEVQFNDGTGLAADTGLTYNQVTDSLNVAGNVITGNIKTDNILHANGVAWDFSQSSYSNGNVQSLLPTYTGNITGLNISASGNLSATNVTGTLTTNAQPNITSVGTLSGLSVTGNIIQTGNLNITGTINATGNIIPSANVTYNLGSPSLRFKDLYLAGTTIDLGGTLIQTAPNGQISIGNATFSSSGSITGTNITGQVPNALVASTVYTGAQPNITSVGTLTSLSVTGTATIGANVIAGNISATSITGGLTTASQPNITSVGTLTSMSVTGNIVAGNISTGSVTGTLTTPAQPNITSLGSLANVVFSGDSYNTHPTSLYNYYGLVVRPTFNGSGTGPELHIDYNDGILISPTTNDYQPGGKAGSLMIEGATTGGNVLPGDVYVSAGSNFGAGTQGNVNIGIYRTNKVVLGTTEVTSGLSVTGGLTASGSINLGNASNVNIYGASANGQALTSDINGHLSWADLPNPGKISITNLVSNSTASLSHAGKLVSYNPVTPGAITYDVPNINTSGFGIGSRIELFVGSQSSITVEPATGSGVSIQSAKPLDATFSSANSWILSNTHSAKLTMIASDSWILSA